ncbi:MAG: anti-sigma K factor RskA [Rhizobiaceae bacterium MnEN-MB40S]|nr:MAG: anti-sigma K factor RskA [Rhizobiaceae bacterium MnEN-MB40S]
MRAPGTISGEDRYQEFDDNQVAEFVLGTLSHDQRAVFINRLRIDPSLAMAVRRWEARLLPSSDEITTDEAQRAANQNTEQALYKAPEQPAAWWSSLAVWQAASAVCLAAVLLLGASLLALQRGTDRFSPVFVGRVAGNPDIVQLLVAYDPARSVLKINRTQGGPGQGRDFELWLISVGNPPASLGLLARDRISEITVPDGLAARMDNAVLAISDEPAGGSSSGQAIGAVLATGNLVRL